MRRTSFGGCVLAALLALGGLSGCALTNKATPTIPRYFTPELPAVTAKSEAPRAGGELQLGRVSASSHIRDKIIYRSSSYEVGFYDDLLWTERPDAYLRRALSQVLFERERLHSVVSGMAPVLDVELVNFEEVREPTHRAVVQLTLILRDDHMVRLEQTLKVERPISAANKAQTPAAIAAALGEALNSAVSEISARVVAELGTKTPTGLAARPTAAAR